MVDEMNDLTTTALLAFPRLRIVEVLNHDDPPIVWLGTDSTPSTEIRLTTLEAIGDLIRRGLAPEMALARALANPMKSYLFKHRNGSIIDMAGQQCGTWLVGELAEAGVANQAHWLCTCVKCGRMELLNSSKLRHSTPTCPGCNPRSRLGIYQPSRSIGL
jgi:hypothetical protein